jgi:hypothetical protein
MHVTPAAEHMSGPPPLLLAPLLLPPLLLPPLLLLVLPPQPIAVPNEAAAAAQHSPATAQPTLRRTFMHPPMTSIVCPTSLGGRTFPLGARRAAQGYTRIA